MDWVKGAEYTLQWIDEIRPHNNANAPVFLLGLQEDLRDDPTTIGKLLQSSRRPVSSDQVYSLPLPFVFPH